MELYFIESEVHTYMVEAYNKYLNAQVVVYITCDLCTWKVLKCKLNRVGNLTGIIYDNPILDNI